MPSRHPVSSCGDTRFAPNCAGRSQEVGHNEVSRTQGSIRHAPIDRTRFTHAWKVFISYRRDDTQGVAGRIYDSLVRDLGEPHVFFDTHSIPTGEDFIEATLSAVESACNTLVIIGTKWLQGEPAGASRRIDDPYDLVHREVEAALLSPQRVVPVLVEDANMPRPDDLPSEQC